MTATCSHRALISVFGNHFTYTFDGVIVWAVLTQARMSSTGTKGEGMQYVYSKRLARTRLPPFWGDVASGLRMGNRR